VFLAFLPMAARNAAVASGSEALADRREER
jgi:hypothetical protein